MFVCFFWFIHFIYKIANVYYGEHNEFLAFLIKLFFLMEGWKTQVNIGRMTADKFDIKNYQDTVID